MKQYRGCSRLVYAMITEGATTTYGTPVAVAPTKTVSREITSDNEDVWADNIVQQKTFAGTKITRTFTVTRIDPAVEAVLLGHGEVTVSGTKKAYTTAPSGSTRPYLAFGYALHDGDADKPCELVWAYKGKVTNITKVSNTIDDGTASEGQEITVEFVAPLNKFTSTTKRNLDISFPIAADDTTTDIDDWFTTVITPDNIATVMG